MQRWPAQPAKDATMSDAVICTSQSAALTRWFFAPPSASAFLPAARARSCTCDVWWRRVLSVQRAGTCEGQRGREYAE